MQTAQRGQSFIRRTNNIEVKSHEITHTAPHSGAVLVLRTRLHRTEVAEAVALYASMQT